MNKTIRAIIFDFGGVLLDWNPRHLYRRYFPDQPLSMEKFLAEIHFSEWNEQQDKGRPFAEGVAELSKKFPSYQQLIQVYDDHWEETIAGQFTGTIKILHSLKTSGYKIFGLSNWSSEKYVLTRPRYSFFELFDDIIVSGEVHMIKPDPAIFQLLLQRINLPASECLLVDDSAGNVEAARSLGFSTIHFTKPELLEIELHRMNVL